MQDRVLTKSFAYPCHQGAVKCIAAGGGYVVSGGADDQLHIYEVQVLHFAPVACCFICLHSADVLTVAEAFVRMTTMYPYFTTEDNGC